MKDVLLIGVCGGSMRGGVMPAGRSTAARILADAYDAHVVDLAAGVRSAAALVFGTLAPTADQMNEICMRGRRIDQAFWLHLALRGLNSLKAIVLDGVCFRNEADFIHAAGGHVVRVTRTGAPDDFLDVPCDVEVVNDKGVWHLGSALLSSTEHWQK